MSYRFAVLLVLAFSVGGIACDDDSDPTADAGDAATDGTPPSDGGSEVRLLGESCRSGDACAEGECVVPEDASAGYCTIDCTGDEDCGGGFCVTWRDGTDRCVPACRANGFSCQDGRPVACQEDGSPHCRHCGCSGDLVCDSVGGACHPRRATGEACASDNQCVSGNCSRWAGVCRVAVGTACTSDNCDLCLEGADDWTFCSRRCGRLFGETSYENFGTPFMDGCAGHTCVGDPEADNAICVPDCDGPCPADACQTAMGDGAETRYCDCAETSCAPTPTLRPEGSVCDADDQCQEGECLGGASGASVGWCAQAGCDGGCADGTVCVDVPCPDGETERCGSRCLPTCNLVNGQCYATPFAIGPMAGTCRPLAGVGGASSEPTLVCDGRNVMNAPCRVNTDCLSGRCTDGQCVGEDPANDGAACEDASDCLSMNCISNICRGRAAEGERCIVDVNCNEGECCEARPGSRECRTSCL